MTIYGQAQVNDIELQVLIYECFFVIPCIVCSLAWSVVRVMVPGCWFWEDCQFM